MSDDIDTADDWTYVIKKKKDKVVSKNSSRKSNSKSTTSAGLCKRAVSSVKIVSVSVAVSVETTKTVEEVHQDVVKTIAALKDTLYYRITLQSLREKDDIFAEVVSLGIGQFSISPCSILQLALITSISQDYSSPSTIYDPLFNNVEKDVCRLLGFKVTEENLKGLQQQQDCQQQRNIPCNKKILYFMPHCPYRLYCNMLYSNWHALDSIVVFGNSFSSYSFRRIHALPNARNDVTDNVDCVLYLEQLVNECSINPSYLKSSHSRGNACLLNMENAFNDLNIHTFDADILESDIGIKLLSHYPHLDDMIAMCNLDTEVY